MRAQAAVAEEADALAAGEDPRLRGLQPETKASHPALDSPVPLVQLALGIREEAEIIHVADIAGTAEFFLYKVVDRIEVDVGEELARQVSDREAAAAFEGREELVAGEVLLHVELEDIGVTCLELGEAQDRCVHPLNDDVVPAHLFHVKRIVAHEAWRVLAHDFLPLGLGHLVSTDRKN
jgi:hypothetical protein